MAYARACVICKKDDKALKGETVVVCKDSMLEVCWPCVALAVEYYKLAMEEGSDE